MKYRFNIMNLIYIFIFISIICFLIIMSISLIESIERYDILENKIEDCDEIKNCKNHLCKIEAYEEYGNRKDDILIEQNNYIICGDEK